LGEFVAKRDEETDLQRNVQSGLCIRDRGIQNVLGRTNELRDYDSREEDLMAMKAQTRVVPLVGVTLVDLRVSKH
jgi:hypothetical protein